MSTYMQKYFRENFNGTETANIQPNESFPIYGKQIYPTVQTVTDDTIKHKHTL